MEEATITSKGQVTIPKDIRQRYGLTEGKKIAFIPENGEIILLPIYKDPIARMIKMREQLKFTQREIEEMIKDSKKSWSKLT